MRAGSAATRAGSAATMRETTTSTGTQPMPETGSRRQPEPPVDGRPYVLVVEAGRYHWISLAVLKDALEEIVFLPPGLSAPPDPHGRP